MKAICPWILVLPGLGACLSNGNTVAMSGTVFDEPFAAGSVVGNVDLQTLDVDAALVDEVTTDEGGGFSMLVPEGEGFFLQLQGPEGEGYVPTAFSGTAGLQDFDSGTGYPWIASSEWFASMQADWAGCPGADVAGTAGSGVAVIGEIRMWMNVSDIDEMPRQQDADVIVSPETGDEVNGCYHDDNGVYDPTATGSGIDGLFAAFGVAPSATDQGLAVTIEFTDIDGTRRPVIYQYRAQDGGLVPLYPAFVYSEGN
jgi:hypothetical protein